MRACDMVVTKAGPGAIAEVLTTGLAIMLTGYLPQSRGDGERDLRDHDRLRALRPQAPAGYWSRSPFSSRTTCGSGARWWSAPPPVARPYASLDIAREALQMAALQRQQGVADRAVGTQGAAPALGAGLPVARPDALRNLAHRRVASAISSSPPPPSPPAVAQVNDLGSTGSRPSAVAPQRRRAPAGDLAAAALPATGSRSCSRRSAKPPPPAAHSARHRWGPPSPPFRVEVGSVDRSGQWSVVKARSTIAGGSARPPPAAKPASCKRPSASRGGLASGIHRRDLHQASSRSASVLAGDRLAGGPQATGAHRAACSTEPCWASRGGAPAGRPVAVPVLARTFAIGADPAEGKPDQGTRRLPDRRRGVGGEASLTQAPQRNR